ncbi:MAG: thiamine pyrophosphate-binding protein [Gammaproteobacteria bacterium]|nr:thiamine pyrophosphate-binding protein [Gammaproteobacteria bacterium]
MKISVSDLIVRFMEQLGISHVFGMPGAHILPVYDSLYHSNIQSILAKHEQGASFMAGGYARASGQISACITTAGPGATNLVTGIANAYVDKQAILVITGETSTHIFGKGGLQESSGEGGSLDQNVLFDSITLYSKLVERTDYLANVLNRAAKILLSDTSGPVLLSFPFNVQTELVDDTLLDAIHFKKHLSCSGAFHHNDHSEAFIQLLTAASAPIIVAGNGCLMSSAQSQVAQLSELMNIPVTSSLKGKGVVAEQEKLSLGSLGVTSYGGAYQYILEQADLIIFLGASFNERTSYVWNDALLKGKKIIQIDNNREQLEKVFKADLAVLADIRLILTPLNSQLRALLNTHKINSKILTASFHEYKMECCEQSRSKLSELYERFPLVALFFQELETHFKKDIMVFDDNIIFAQNFFNVSSENNYYSNSGISSLGHAIPAAIGARFANNKIPFAIIGDGGFQMCCMEIMTAVNYQLPLTIVLFNNATMGLIRKNQFQQYDERYINCDFINPDYALLARSFGIHHYLVRSESDLEGLLPRIDCHSCINLIEIMIDKDTFPGYTSNR